MENAMSASAFVPSRQACAFSNARAAVSIVNVRHRRVVRQKRLREEEEAAYQELDRLEKEKQDVRKPYCMTNRLPSQRATDVLKRRRLHSDALVKTCTANCCSLECMRCGKPKQFRIGRDDWRLIKLIDPNSDSETVSGSQSRICQDVIFKQLQ
jgi:hypothetical protein